MSGQNPNISFSDYCGLAGDEHVLLTIWVDGERKGSTLYNRSWFSTFSRNRAIKRLKKQL